jgi:uncharacterized damage-inducible protein DinB
MVSRFQIIQEFQIWADDFLIEQLAKVTDEEFNTTFGGFEDGSLKHLTGILVDTLYLWIQRLKGTSLREFPRFDKLPRADLLKLWKEYNQELTFYFEDKIIENVSYRNTRGDKFWNTKYDILVHLSAHTSYYRGMIVLVMRQLGKQVEDHDYIHLRRRGQIS